MLFNSAIFLFFFTPYLVLHSILPQNWRLFLVIIGSSVFYAYWKPLYAPLPLILTVLAQAGGVWISRSENQTTRGWRTTLIVSLLLIPLAFYKYTNFLMENLFPTFSASHGKWVSYSLPLGISFITFTLIAYCVDIYRRKHTVEESFSLLLGSVIFFPHLIAGPIVRPSQLVSQLSSFKKLSLDRLRYGAFVFAFGLFKKMVIADPLGAIIDDIYRNIGSSEQAAWLHLFGFYGFSFQIFCDFSGYSDMAIGLAHILGIRLPQNFNSPYSSASLTEFWKRWHITLSRWLRDYLYIPLGGNRCRFSKQLRNIVITMALGGLWHGASWTFLFWGLLHGIGICVNHVLIKSERQFPIWVKRLVVFHFVSLAWVLFRSQNMTIATGLMGGIFSRAWITHGMERQAFPLLLLVLAATFHYWDRHAFLRWANFRFHAKKIWIATLFLILLSVVVGAGSSQQFIYFEF